MSNNKTTLDYLVVRRNYLAIQEAEIFGTTQPEDLFRLRTEISLLEQMIEEIQGDKLAEIANDYQTMITHKLPSLAASAKRHLGGAQGLI